MSTHKRFDSDEDDDIFFSAIGEGSLEDDGSRSDDQDLLAPGVDLDKDASDDDMPEAVGLKEGKQTMLDTVKRSNESDWSTQAGKERKIGRNRQSLLLKRKRRWRHWRS